MNNPYDSHTNERDFDRLCFEGDLSVDLNNTDRTSNIFSVSAELKKLNVRRRNQVRSLLYVPIADAIGLLNNLRKNSSAKELYQIDRILRSNANPRGAITPDLFPVDVQADENYHRLDGIPIDTQLSIIEFATSEHERRLADFLQECGKLSSEIAIRDIESSDSLVGKIFLEFGYSHMLLRKAALTYTLNVDSKPMPNIEKLLGKAGLGRNNVICTSLIHSYQEEKNFLSIKRSIMTLRNRGVSNKYTRDISRIPFHPHAKDPNDLGELVQSSLQSSLIDALIMIKINRRLIDMRGLESINRFIKIAESVAVDEIASSYLNVDDGESMFYKHSSAWLEGRQISEYRNLIDHFFDAPESKYFEINEVILGRAKEWVGDIRLPDLADAHAITKHPHKVLRELEFMGNVTRSAAFNYLTFLCGGHEVIPEEQLIKIMERTQDLDRTVDIAHIKAMAQNSGSKISKIIYYLLIAKRSKNEADNHQLRRLIQEVVKGLYDGKLISFVVGLSEKSRVIAEYSYEVCTEDFIAKLSHIISSASEITETRAALHKWMGETSGEKSYIDRARTLLIDHQINRIRNEIDDNRIYVDTARFSEWINDELLRELNSALTSMEHNSTMGIEGEPQLMYVLDRSYAAFCSNNIFGIASYLGRRIRHGTFKGHLYSGVVSLEEQYVQLLKDPILGAKWSEWKSAYESQIDEIIRDRLHIESGTKRDGLIEASIKQAAKTTIVSACLQALAKDYAEHRSSATAIQLLTEYCWRLAEVDLRNINAFLKGKKGDLLSHEFIIDFKNSANGFHSSQARDFTRDLLHEINERLQTMYGWFKRPLSVSPKASLSLLFKAVVAEVRDVFSHLHADTSFDEQNDIEIIGGAYHVLYDAFYVVVYNAAKHGKVGEQIEREFQLGYDKSARCVEVRITITSAIRDSDSEQFVNERLSVSPNDDIANAQLNETRSGIKKLYHLQNSDSNFSILNILCEGRKVVVAMAYKLEH